MWVYLFLPGELVSIVWIVLHETSELPLEKNTASVVEVVAGHVFDLVLNLGSQGSLLLDTPLGLNVLEKWDTQQKEKPEVSVSLELEVLVVVHQVVTLCLLVVSFVGEHPILEMGLVFWSDLLGVLMSVLQEVVSVRVVKSSDVTDSLTSFGASSLLWNTSIVVA